jgi:hypothetical protein
MAAWMGTAIHDAIERKIKRTDNPFTPRYRTEMEVTHDGLTGHVDLYDTETYEVVDWKTITKKKVSYFPSSQQRMQVQIYGYLLTQNGYRVDNVTLVGIPRDGNELDLVVHTEPYEPLIAQEGLAWVRSITDNLDVIPEPEESRRFCQDYCQFFDPSAEVGCPSRG